MTKRTKNRIVTVSALLLIAVAVFLAVQLMLGNEGIFAGTPEETQAQEETTLLPATDYETSASVSDVDSKFLWEYGV